ncbi:MAG: hypothetical protein ACKVYV_16325, partial [Limisphaerales bacterium]
MSALKLITVLLVLGAVRARATPRFEVPGLAPELDRLEQLFELHRVSPPATTLWDAWLPMSLLWADTTNAPSTDALRATVRRHLLNRRINADGYVHTQQHEGLAHSEGWPFPTWTQAGGIGWHFSVQGLPYGPELGIHRATSTTNWMLAGAASGVLGEKSGWSLTLTNAAAVVTTPPFDVDSFVAPFIRVKWSARGLGVAAQPFLEWTTTEQGGFSPDRRMYFAAVPEDGAVHDTDVPLHRHP